MGWASHYITKLQAGETVQFRPRGGSMEGKISSGQLVTVVPLPHLPSVNDIVLCKVSGSEYLHLVKAIQADRVLIGNNRGYTNGWTSLRNVFGLVTRVED